MSSVLICLATHKTELKFPMALGYLLKKRIIVANFPSSSKVLVIRKMPLGTCQMSFLFGQGDLQYFFNHFFFFSHLFESFPSSATFRNGGCSTADIKNLRIPETHEMSSSALYLYCTQITCFPVAKHQWNSRGLMHTAADPSCPSSRE